MIALILGGAPSVWRELAEAQALLNRRHLVVAANLAGIHFAGHLDGWCSLHADLLPKWAAERAGEPATRLFTPQTTPERWPGSSGLYAAQCALFELGATASILCGVPMESEAGHFTGRERWEGVSDYRQAFAAALPEIGGRVRSMSGWTAELFGAPSAAWIDAVDNIKPLGATPDQTSRQSMYTVKNVSRASTAFNFRTSNGDLGRIRLAPGEVSDPVEVDVAQAAFVRGDLKSTPVAPKTPTPKARRKSALTRNA